MRVTIQGADELTAGPSWAHLQSLVRSMTGAPAGLLVAIKRLDGACDYRATEATYRTRFDPHDGRPTILVELAVSNRGHSALPEVTK